MLCSSLCGNHTIGKKEVLHQLIGHLYIYILIIYIPIYASIPKILRFGTAINSLNILNKSSPFQKKKHHEIFTPLSRHDDKRP